MQLQNYINGQWCHSQSQEFFQVINPATEELLAKTPMSTESDCALAIEAAKKAYPSWRQVPASARIQYLFQLKTLLEANFERLSKVITLEHGKTLQEARGSMRRAIQMVECATSIPSLMMGENSENIAAGIDCSTVLRPMGVFAAIVPFNFPAMVPFWFWPFAVACGNTFVIKPSERVPMTMTEIFKLIDTLGFPKGVINMVHGAKPVVDCLTAHPDVKGVSFVGSTAVAKYVYTRATSHGKRVQALGGAKNLMVAMPDAVSGNVRQRCVATAVESITGCAGERCLAGSLILCVGDVCYDAFKDEATSVAKGITVGNGIDEKNQMGPLISEASRSRVIGMIDRAISNGAKLLLDGRVPPKGKGYFLRPTVLCDIKADWEIAREEVFGPVILLAKVASLDEAIEWINSIDYANTCTLFTESGAAARRFANMVDPSMIGINIGVPAPMAFFSFGGSKASFFGDIKVHGRACTQFYTDTYTTIYRWNSENGIW